MENDVIKVNDVIYTNIKNISWTNILSEDDSIFEQESLLVGEQAIYNTNKNIPDDMLIALRYLGNGVFEEYSTREKMLLAKSTTIDYYDDEKGEIKKRLEDYHDNGSYTFIDGFYEEILLDYDEYLNNYDDCKNLFFSSGHERVLTKDEYVNAINKLVEVSSNYPLQIWCDYYSSESSKETQELYTKYSDEERASIINTARMMAGSSLQKVTEKANEAISNIKSNSLSM